MWYNKVIKCFEGSFVMLGDIFDGIYGNEQLKKYLSTSISEGKLPHALIFEGPEGCGKKTLAKMTAAKIEPQYADKIMKRLSPDVTVHGAEDGKKSVGISVIREIRESSVITPQELSVRVFIIDMAHTMTTEAQNALLKILEEPPKGVFFILLSQNASALLATVRSRAPVLRLQTFENGELSDYMIRTNEKAQKMSLRDPEGFEMLVRSAQGSIGGVLSRLEGTSGSAQKLRDKTDALISALSGGKKSDIVLFFGTAKLDREELSLLLLNLEGAVRDMLTVKYGANAEKLYFLSDQAAEDASSDFARSTLVNIYSACMEMRKRLNVNVNAQLIAFRCADALSVAVR